VQSMRCVQPRKDMRVRAPLPGPVAEALRSADAAVSLPSPSDSPNAGSDELDAARLIAVCTFGSLAD